MSIKIRRDGNCLDFIVPTYNTIDLYSLDYKENENNSLTKLNDSTILIKCKYIDTTGFRKTLSEDKLLKWFIFDLRSSTEWIKPIVEDFFINRKTAFCSTFTPLPSRPGFFSDPTSITIGPGNQELFIKGAHVIILVNENTQSQGEFQTMFLQSIPNSITIGSHTAGSDGNVTEYPIPGNITIGMTGLGIQYPDGTKSQKNGVKIDYYLSPILKSAKKGIDQDLDFALKLIERTKNQSSTH
jgi:hypothetical protein